MHKAYRFKIFKIFTSPLKFAKFFICALIKHVYFTFVDFPNEIRSNYFSYFTAIFYGVMADILYFV